MSRLTSILILSFVVLLATGTVIYAQAADNDTQNQGVSGNEGAWHNDMFDYCLSNSDLTPEQRDQLEQNMRNHMENGNWDEMWQWMEQNGWQNHMGDNNPMNAGNWDEMWQQMDEHMGDGTWQNHVGYGHGNGQDDTGVSGSGVPSEDTESGNGYSGYGAGMGSGHYGGGMMS